MVTSSYLLGRRFYPVPYDVIRVVGYIALGLGLYAGNRALIERFAWNSWASASLLMALFFAIVLLLDGRRLRPAPA
jgi:hypothetical protein